MPAITRPAPSRPATPRRAARPVAVAAAVLALLLALAGCSEDPAEGEQPELGGAVTEPEQGIAEAGEAQLAPGAGVADPAEGQADPQDAGADVAADPAGGDASFVPGDFGEVPLPTGAQPYDQATTEDDVVVQSFRVTATSPQSVIDYYREELTAMGWTQGQEESSGETGQGGAPSQIRATFTMDGQTLLVTATELDPVDEDGASSEDDTQLTLQLSGV